MISKSQGGKSNRHVLNRADRTHKQQYVYPPVEVDGWQICVQPVCASVAFFFIFLFIYFFYFSFFSSPQGVIQEVRKQTTAASAFPRRRPKKTDGNYTHITRRKLLQFFFLFCFLVSSQQTLTDSPVCPYHQFERRNNHIFRANIFSGMLFLSSRQASGRKGGA